MELPKILQNAEKIAKHKFTCEHLAGRYRISYTEVLTSQGNLREGASVVGWCKEGCGYLVMFELPDGRKVFFHYFERDGKPFGGMD